MQVQVDIGFDQLVQIARRLPPKQWTKLKQEVETTMPPADSEREAFKQLLLSGPTFTKKQLNDMAKTRIYLNRSI